MNDLERALINRIVGEGPLTWAEFMEAALYDPQHGYYRSGSERTGWSGDFITSPEIDPAFGSLWGHAFRDLWVSLGRPPEFEVIELGPGEGGFARALLSEGPEDLRAALRLTLVEIDPPRRARQADALGDPRVRWAASVEDVQPFDAGVVFANEVLDNQPVHVLRNRAGGFQELHVDAGDSGLEETWLDCTDENLVRRALASDTPAGTEVEISFAAEELALQCARLPRAGAAIFVDYGKRATEDGPPGTLASYSHRGAGGRSAREPGEADITAHVDWAAVKEACRQERGVETFGPRSQREVLVALGAHDLDDELRALHAQELERGRGAPALQALSRRQAIGALLDPGGLGGLQVVVAARGLDIGDWMKEKDRPEGRS